jgi:hypothetical protein
MSIHELAADGDGDTAAQRRPKVARKRSVLDASPEDANADGLALYSPDRFLEAANGDLEVEVFVDEVVAHVERQLPRRRRRI